MDIDFLKNWGFSERHDRQGSGLSIKHQCELLDINRNVFYYKPHDSEETLLLMRLIDAIFTDDMIGVSQICCGRAYKVLLTF